MAEPRKDLYATLGVARDADADAIKKAYRKLARELHPDLNPGDARAEERFKAVSEAYAVLSDAERRRNYDEFGEVSLEGGFDAEAARRARESFGARFGGAPYGAPGGGAFEFGDLEDLLGRVFQGEAGGRARGRDMAAVLELDFLEAARGGEKRLTLQVPAEDGGMRSETVTVRIPAGVADGGQIRLRGRGAPGRSGGARGDLVAEIRVRPHPVFRREGRDLHLEVPVSVLEAVKGARIEVPTLDGRATLRLPPGTDSGRKLRLKGKGIADPGGGPPGDLYVTVQIRVPRDLGPEALAKLAEVDAGDPAALRAELFR